MIMDAPAARRGLPLRQPPLVAPTSVAEPAQWLSSCDRPPLKTGHAWRNAERIIRTSQRHARLSVKSVSHYLAYLAATDPQDRLAEALLDELRIDGHVWQEVPAKEYCTLPVGRQWTDEEEQELHRQEESRLRERRENAFEFVVVKQRKA